MGFEKEEENHDLIVQLALLVEKNQNKTFIRELFCTAG